MKSKNALHVSLVMAFFFLLLLWISEAYATPIDEMPGSVPSWWGSAEGQTASLYADFSTPGLDWDEYIIGDNLQIGDFSISIIDMIWVDDSIQGKGYQPTSPGEMIFTYDNFLVLTNSKHLVDKLLITPNDPNEDISKVIVEADWGNGWSEGGAIGGITSKWTYTEQPNGKWLIDIDATITPQPHKARIRIQTKGGSGPVIHRGWTGEHCTPIPEPSTYLLFVTGLIITFRTARKKRVGTCI